MGNPKLISIFVGLCLLGFACASYGAGSNQKAKKADVRLLIDISGSMKKNDPNNLRIPALQLVTNLLPKNSDAGVWAFGRYVNMMVPLSKVDQNWQVKATKAATKINSRGLYTNIGDVLQKSSYGWSKADPNEKRSIILLTDGMVDISKDPKINENERKRILNKILPKLQNENVSIHTIALSQNADHELLKQLSTQTDGWYQAVNNADELQKVFLKIFEQAAERDNLPISDNQFNVDKSIDEMTVLVFKQDASSAKLISPSGLALSESDSEKGVRWFSTDGYDLVTLQKPEPGQWKIDAKVDPDNRVMVVSKLGLSIADLPNNLLAGEAINYELQLLEEGDVITNQDFLNLVDTKLEQDKNGQTSRLAMFYDVANHTFKQNFFTDSFEGELKLRLQVTSPTFERVRTHAINIYGSPLIVDIDISEDNIQPHKAILSVRDDIVKPESLQINATINKPDGEKVYEVIEDFSQPIEIPAFISGGDYTVEFKITGKSVLNRSFSVTPGAVTFSSKSLIEEAIEEVKETPEIKEEPKIEEEKTAIIEETNENAEEESGINWTYIGIGVNILFAIIGFFAWRFFKKRSTEAAAKVAGELSVDEDEDDDEEELKDEDKENQS